MRWVSVFAAAALAAAPALSAESERPTYEVEFEAGRLELDTRLQRLELADDVTVRVGRYQLTGDRLSVERGPRGVAVEGDGRIAFCPCPDPPLTLGFSAATLAPPTDVLLEQPTVRIGDVPILWLPWLWLRSPQRLGLLPPRVAWRGEDGLFAGSGVHVPLGTSERPAWIDVAAGGYLEGGADVDVHLETPDSTTHVRWDHLDESLLALDVRGSAFDRDGGGAAWQIDAIRGARGRRGTLSLEQASRRFDRAELAVGGATGGFVAALGARADAERGGAMDELGHVGPAAHVGAGAALGGAGAADASLDVRTTRNMELGAQSFASQLGSIELDGRPGPFAVELEIGERVDASASEASEGAFAVAGARSALSLPLARDFGTGSDMLRHWIEPFAESALVATASRGEPLGDSLDGSLGERDATLVSAVAGIRTTLGAWARRTGAELVVRGGWAGEPDALERLAAGRLVLRSEWLGASSDAAYEFSGQALVALSRLRLGPEQGLHVTGYADGRLDTEPAGARLLANPGWRAQRAGWLDRPGWTVGGALAVPFATWLAARVGADYDLEAESLLGVRGAAGYRHACGCLALSAWAGRRIGRDGIDVWATLDLLP